MGKVSVAIIGLNGFLGKPVLEAINSGKFDDKLQFPIKALTRKEQPSTDKIQYITTDISDETVSSIGESLKGTEVIVELVKADPTLFGVIEKVVAEVKPKLFVPSQFGTDLIQVDDYAPGFLALKTQHSANVRKLGVKVVDVITSLFAVPGAFLYEIVGAVGIDPTTNTIVQRGDASSKFSISKLEDIGLSVVSLITLPISELPDTVRVQSQVISFQDVYDRYEKDHNVKLTVKEKYTKEEALAELKSKYAAGFEFKDFLFYLQAIAAQGVDKGLYFSEVHNELVNPGEKYWKWGKF
ncbi:CIP1 protein [Scheffersomyces amazonensis]|uniref:CIP1 protein n=1 Tax=Scheffersomyces amazonensis TaxID=1078765 RepID=UPI00315C68E1